MCTLNGHLVELRSRVKKKIYFIIFICACGMPSGVAVRPALPICCAFHRYVLLIRLVSGIFADSLRKLPNSWNTHPQLTEHLWLNMVCLEEHCIHTGLQPQWCANWNYDLTALPWYTAQLFSTARVICPALPHAPSPPVLGLVARPQKSGQSRCPVIHGRRACTFRAQCRDVAEDLHIVVCRRQLCSWCATGCLNFAISSDNLAISDAIAAHRQLCWGPSPPPPPAAPWVAATLCSGGCQSSHYHFGIYV